jgi:hypothetical protein
MGSGLDVSTTTTMDKPNTVGPAPATIGRIGRMERAILADRIVNGGDIEVAPSELGAGRILRLSTGLMARLGLVAGGRPKPAEEASVAALGASVVMLRIHGLHPDSPASGVRMYHGDIYANGSDAAITTADVTVKIPGIAGNVLLPSTGTWADVNPILCIGITQTWVGATVTHTDDMVYETAGLLLML